MTVKQIAEYLECRTICGGNALEKQVTDGYSGDLLSWVMGRAPAGSAWITVMGNVNAVAVAVLADAACIILAEGAVLDGEAAAKALSNNVAVLCSDRTSFDLASNLSRIFRL